MSTIMARTSEQVTNLSVTELESLIRRIVRDEIENLIPKLSLYEEPTLVEPGSPLYENMIDIQHRAQEGKLRFYTHEEVWGNEPV